MKPHECRPDRACTCSLLALEPDEGCAIHGAGRWPPRCGACGRFLPQTPSPVPAAAEESHA